MRRSLLLGSVLAIVAAAALTLGPASGVVLGGARSSCPSTQNVSVESKTPSTIEFFNATPGAINVHWLSFNGSRVFYFTLQPRDSVAQQNFLTHAWLVLDSAGACVGYVVSDQPSKRYFVMPGSQSATRTYIDATGDGAGAGDLTTTEVLNDTTGQITFRIDVPNRAEFTGDDDLSLFFDTDQNPSTGDSKFSSGAEYWLFLLGLGGGGGSTNFRHWNGSAFEPAPRDTVHVSYTNRGFNISINRSDLGGVSGFNFQLSTEPIPGDQAPNSGSWNYVLQSPLPTDSTQPTESEEPATFTISALKVRTRPAAPTAGSIFKVLVPSITLKGAGTESPESVKCRASLGGRPFNGKRAGGCTFAISKRAGGKKLVIKITVVYQGSTKTKTVRFTVRRPR